MKFIKLEMAHTSAPDTRLTLGAVLPAIEWPNEEGGEAEAVRFFIEGCFQADGAMLLKDSEGVTRYFGAAVMAQTMLTAAIVDITDQAEALADAA